jgi:hypothetical protein
MMKGKLGFQGTRGIFIQWWKIRDINWTGI